MCKMFRRGAYIFNVHARTNIAGKFQDLAVKSAVLSGFHNTFVKHCDRLERAEIVTRDKLYFVSSDDKCTYQKDTTTNEITKVASWRYDLQNVFNIFADGKLVQPWHILEISNRMHLRNALQTYDTTGGKLEYVDSRFCIMNFGDNAKVVDRLGELKIRNLEAPLLYQGYCGNSPNRTHYFSNPVHDVTYEVVIK